MEKIVFAGSFDPLTNGHLWVIEEGLKIANKVAVFVAENSSKKTMFTAQERLQMIEESCKAKGIKDRVEVMIIRNEYVAKKAIQIGATHLIRGIRSAIDFDYEGLIQKTNVDVLGGAKTIFVMPPRDLESVSSSFVKSLIGPVGWHWHVKQFLPAPVYKKLLKDFVSKTAKVMISQDNLEDFLKIVFENYNSSDRYYHNLEHIVHCLQEMLWLNSNSSETIDYEQLCIAILAHDIVYGAKQEKTDELLSAELLLEKLGPAYRPAYDLVLATQHFKEKKDFSLEEKIMRSLDLTILGQDIKLYKKYSQNVRKEYSFVNDEAYKNGRIKVLESFLNKDVIFEASVFTHYEIQARQNIKKELTKLINY